MTLPPGPTGEALARLREAFAKIDAFSERVSQAHPEDVACGPGCHDCCRGGLSLRAVEAAFLAEAVRALPPEAAAAVGRGLTEGEDGACSLLLSGRCAAYERRPAVCRSHGLPMLRAEGGGVSVHHCPRNFRGVESRTLPASLLLDEAHLAVLMDAVDALYSRQSGWGGGRIPLADLVRAGLQNSSC
ncbi:MAG: YkgJ family cysteine cluster protein [Deltaproteobacteria bacterium]|nr:YkgJ family cysteine cluster protein [Deltaproteobacteria bacterium]